MSHATLNALFQAVPHRLRAGPLRAARRGSAAIGFAIGAPVAVAAALAGLATIATFQPIDPIDSAARRATEMVALYSRLYDSDITDTILPVAQGIAGKDAEGRTHACGIVVTGLAAASEDGSRPIAWQKSYGPCAVSHLVVQAADARIEGPGARLPDTRLPPGPIPPTQRPAAQLPPGHAAAPGAPAVVVEVAANPGDDGRYAAFVAVPIKLTLPTIVAGSRY